MPFLAGSFLVARPVLQDPNFARAVVLLLEHGDEGAFGLVVNRPAEVEGVPFPVYSGGPCSADGLLMVHGHPEWIEEPGELEKSQVGQGLYIGDADCLARVTDPPAGQTLRFRVFSGYAGWAPGQLEGELASGAWAVAHADAHVLFDTPVQDLWDHLVPPTIPQPSSN
jgi:putative transcriptional regulator